VGRGGNDACTPPSAAAPVGREVIAEDAPEHVRQDSRVIASSLGTDRVVGSGVVTPRITEDREAVLAGARPEHLEG
jgi:hypothetical protein